MEHLSKGSTPNIVIKCPVNPNLYSSGYLTISQGINRLSTLTSVIDKNLSSMTIDTTEKTISYRPTQAEMIQLDPTKMCFVQFRCIDGNGLEFHTDVVDCTIDQILHAGVIA